MLSRHAVSDEHWERIKDFLPGQAGDPGVSAKDNRLFIDAVLWIAKTGAPWRDLPARFGNSNSVWRRFDRWARKGIWKRIFCELQDPDLEWLIVDTSVIRAHQHAAGAKKGHRRGPEPAGTGLGLPVDLSVTPGQTADITQAEALLHGHDFTAALADKGYDSQKLVDYIESRGAEAVIPPRSHLKNQREYDRHLYKERNLVERFFSRIKQFRRVATRYEKTARNFLAFVQVAAITVLLQ